MKQLKMSIVVLIVMLLLYGCGSNSSDVHFFYLRNEYQYGTSYGLYDCETRTVIERSRDVEYLLKLYFDGPIDKDFVSPFPAGVALDHVSLSEKTMTVFLSEEYNTLSGIQLSIANACIAETCFNLAEIDHLIISTDANQKTFSFSRETFHEVFRNMLSDTQTQ